MLIEGGLFAGQKVVGGWLQVRSIALHGIKAARAHAARAAAIGLSDKAGKHRFEMNWII